MTEKLKVAVGLQESFLNDVGGVELALETPADFDTGQQAQIVAIALQQRPQRRFAACFGVQDHLFRIHDVPILPGEFSSLRGCPSRVQ